MIFLKKANIKSQWAKEKKNMVKIGEGHVKRQVNLEPFLKRAPIWLQLLHPKTVQNKPCCIPNTMQYHWLLVLEHSFLLNRYAASSFLVSPLKQFLKISGEALVFEKFSYLLIKLGLETILHSMTDLLLYRFYQKLMYKMEEYTCFFWIFSNYFQAWPTMSNGQMCCIRR